ncbi:DUF1799 domain-containing protein [Zhongshania aliphaticivorans]|uniref:DUF1799 domain-containing protein n=1 Tax=Zhongshania aliphaticivorans TaxID=1470434 RepID=UPI0012E54D15|nr:DUF1799 domain-containing protein [Zhongshania aliphaticivorans]CAA0103594.1 Uncharacterised protein [Zhongshania aliphaticivorans]
MVSNTDRIREQYKQLGATETDTAWLDQEEVIATEGIQVQAANWPAFSLFLACSRQWDSAISPLGEVVRMGLRWSDVETRAKRMPECRALNEEETDQLWRDITVLQNHALEAFAELRDEQQR